MSNLKKVLSVGLASTMVLGMMTTAGAASYEKFTDKADIEHKDAVSMVSELGIIAGLTNGTYAPKQNIDRASFARLVCVALNGGKEPNLGNLKTSFTDTQGHWAEKYIAYCVDRGIIAGRGDGTFAPSANVTGSEAAKMLLVALGYNTKYEGIGGATWQTTTDVLANLAGLYDDLESMNTSAPLTRDNAAQMIYNALDADTVTYSWTYNANGTSVAVQNKTGKTMLEDKFNAIKVEGIVVANEFANLESTAKASNGTDVIGSSLDKGKTRIDVTNYGRDEDQTVFNDGTYSVSTGENELGKAITLYVKNDSGNTSKATVLGNAIVSDDNKVVTNSANKLLSKIADDNDLTIPSDTPVAFNYASAGTYGDYADAKVRGMEKTLIDSDDDGDVDQILINTLYFGQVSKKSTKDDGSLTVDIGSANLSADDKDDVKGFDDVAEDDYVLSAWIGGDLHVQKAESVTGELESYKTDSGKVTEVTVAGTKYDVSAIAGFTGGDDDVKTVSTEVEDVKNAVDTEATFYLDRNGKVVAMGDVSANASNYAYVWAYGDSSSGIDSDRVKVTLSDGTTKTYTLADKSAKPTGKTTTVSNDATAAGRIYSYSINKDGEIKLSAAKATLRTDAQDAKFSKNKTKVTAVDGDKVGAGATTSYASSSTVFFYVSLKGNKIDDVDVYTGYTKAPSVTGAYGEAAFNSNAKMAAVSFTAANLSNSDVEDHLFVTGIVAVGSKTTTVKAILPGTTEAVEIKVDGEWDTKGLALYSIDSDGVYTLDTDTGADTDEVVSFSNTTVATANNEYKMIDKTVWIELDDGGDFDSASLKKLPKDTDQYTVQEILVNNDDEILMIVTKENKDEETPVVTEGIDVSVSGTNEITVTWHNADGAPADKDVVTAIRQKLADENGLASYEDITTTNAGRVYTFVAKVGGATTTYTCDLATAVSQAEATTAVTVTEVSGCKVDNASKAITKVESGAKIKVALSDKKSTLDKVETTSELTAVEGVYTLDTTTGSLKITVTAKADGYKDKTSIITYTLANA